MECAFYLSHVVRGEDDHPLWLGAPKSGPHDLTGARIHPRGRLKQKKEEREQRKEKKKRQEKRRENKEWRNTMSVKRYEGKRIE